MGINERHLEELLEQAASLSPTGEHAYLWFDKRAKRIAIRPPLPDNLRSQAMVKGLSSGEG
jgi:hypothetical protein